MADDPFKRTLSKQNNVEDISRALSPQTLATPVQMARLLDAALRLNNHAAALSVAEALLQETTRRGSVDREALGGSLGWGRALEAPTDSMSDSERALFARRGAVQAIQGLYETTANGLNEDDLAHNKRLAVSRLLKLGAGVETPELAASLVAEAQLAKSKDSWMQWSPAQDRSIGETLAYAVYDAAGEHSDLVDELATLLNEGGGSSRSARHVASIVSGMSVTPRSAPLAYLVEGEAFRNKDEQRELADLDLLLTAVELWQKAILRGLASGTDVSQMTEHVESLSMTAREAGASPYFLGRQQGSLDLLGR